MSPTPPTIDDIIEAVREDDIESIIAEARDGCDWLPDADHSTAQERE